MEIPPALQKILVTECYKWKIDYNKKEPTEIIIVKIQHTWQSLPQYMIGTVGFGKIVHIFTKIHQHNNGNESWGYSPLCQFLDIKKDFTILPAKIQTITCNECNRLAKDHQIELKP